MSDKRIGSSIDDFLKKEGIFEEAQAQAVKEVVAWAARRRNYARQPPTSGCDGRAACNAPARRFVWGGPPGPRGTPSSRH